MAAILKVLRHIKNPTKSIDAYSRPIYSKNNSAKFHPDSIWNDGALGFLKRSPQQQQQDV